MAAAPVAFGRPPILLENREEPFTCVVCGKPGWGGRNAKVHNGACCNEWARRRALRSAAKRRRKGAPC